MSFNILSIFKFVLTLSLIFLSLFFFNKGNELLKSIDKIKLKVSTPPKYENTNKNILILNNKVNKKTLLTENFLIKDNLNVNKKNIYDEIIIKVKKNDTFSKIIDPFFNENKIKNKIINKLSEEYNLRKLRVDQKIYFYKNKEGIVKKIIMPTDFATDLVINISGVNITLLKENIDISKETHSIEFIISSSVYEDGKKAGVPLSILSDAIRLYSFDVDFQRDIQKNNKFSISYEVLLNTKRETVSYGKIKYINLNFQKNNLEYFIFKTNDGFFDYFNKDGKNVRKSILKTPIDGARLSSSFGIRKHPILGFNKLHKGVDFAAPTGSPIYAGGNGIIEYAGVNGGYGKYIRIRHNSEYKTAYAHLRGFKKGISKGIRVKQGEIIGYVGSSGKSTGPHLHYEILYQNKQINPLKMKLPSGKILQGKELEKFKDEVKIIYSNYLFNLYE